MIFFLNHVQSKLTLIVVIKKNKCVACIITLIKSNKSTSKFLTHALTLNFVEASFCFLHDELCKLFWLASLWGRTSKKYCAIKLSSNV